MASRGTISGRSRRPRSRSVLSGALADWRVWLLPIFVMAAVVLGGASAAGILPNALLQLLAVGLIWLCLAQPSPRPLAQPERAVLALGAVLLALILLQLIPLPPSLWQALPGRAPVAAPFALLGAPLPWLPLSLAPAATVASALALTIAAAAFVLVRRTPDDGLGRFAWAVVAIASVSVIIGFLQLVSGLQSPLYIYTITNRGQPVGFFANSNHLATLELMAMPMLAALAAMAARPRGADGEVEGRAGNIVILVTLAVVLLLGIATNGSLAGLGLMVPTLIGCLLLFRGGRNRRLAVLGFAAALAVVGIFIALSLSSPIVSGYANTSLDATPTSRLTLVQHSLPVIRSYLPFGSGLGSFVSVYPAFEDASKVGPVFINHAHDDYIELLIELGIPGALLIIGFLLWWGWRVITIWRDRESSVMLRAATISSAVVLVHSLVDYPGRTAAIMAIFAACCAIMARPGRVRAVPPPVVQREDTAPARHLSA